MADISAGTLTISNLGMLGIDRFDAIHNVPQVAGRDDAKFGHATPCANCGTLRRARLARLVDVRTVLDAVDI